MSHLQEAHIACVEAVNNAKTQSEHDAASLFLRGFRAGLQAAEQDGIAHGYHLIACDQHYLDQGIDRPMCCGVFLDWSPA